MKQYVKYALSFVLLGAINSTNAAAGWFVEGAALTSFYNYNERDARNALPDRVTQFLGDDDLTGSDNDLINYYLAAGYYVTPTTSMKLTYASGIDLGFLDGLSCLFCSDGTEHYHTDAELSYISTDVTHRLYTINGAFHFYAKAGVAYYYIESMTRQKQSSEWTTISTDKANKWGVLGGVGVAWDITDNVSLNGGVSLHQFMAIKQYSIALEYRF